MEVIFPLASWVDGIISLFFGRKYYLLWIGFTIFLYSSRVIDILLYQSNDLLRNLSAVIGGLLIALLFVVLSRKFQIIARIPVGALAGVILASELIGVFLPALSRNPYVIVLLIAAGLGAVLLALSFDIIAILLSSAIGASLLFSGLADLSSTVSNRPHVFYFGLLLIGVLFQWYTWKK